MNATDHPLYPTWATMVARCHSAENPSYRYYGARGISVCLRWRNDFWRFAEDMGDRPEGLTLDRKDSRGNYGPANCRWATQAEQDSTCARRKPRPIREIVPTDDARSNGLTGAQTKVMHLMGAAATQKEVALALGISIRTAEVHWAEVLRKTGVNGLVQFGIWYAFNHPERLIEWVRA